VYRVRTAMWLALEVVCRTRWRTKAWAISNNTRYGRQDFRAAGLLLDTAALMTIVGVRIPPVYCLSSAQDIKCNIGLLIRTTGNACDRQIEKVGSENIQLVDRTIRKVSPPTASPKKSSVLLSQPLNSTYATSIDLAFPFELCGQASATLTQFHHHESWHFTAKRVPPGTEE